MAARRLPYALLALALAVLLSAAAAAPGRAADCDSDIACAQLAEKAFQASQQSSFDEAQRIYEQAYALIPDPKLLYNLARVLHKASRYAAAATYYQRYIAVGAGGNSSQLLKADRYLQEARLAAAAMARAGSSAPRSPVYRKWWLWTTVGVVAAGLALGLGLGLASRPPDTADAYPVSLTK